MVSEVSEVMFEVVSEVSETVSEVGTPISSVAESGVFITGKDLPPELIPEGGREVTLTITFGGWS